MSIYSNLFRYRPRPKRNPFEDFLSEALVDLLNRLSFKQQVSFIADILLRDTDILSSWHSLSTNQPQALLRWETQRSINGGIIDIILNVNGEPTIVVENKIGAMIRPHTINENTENERQDIEFEPASGNQIRTYGKWLSLQRHDSPSLIALVLLTHFSKPPDDFGSEAYHVPNVAVCRWQAVWLWAHNLSLEPEFQQVAEGRVYINILREFADFLKEESMSSDFATPRDLAIAQVFCDSSSRITNTFKVIRQDLDLFKQSLNASTSKIYREDFNSEGSVVWAWAYFKNPPKICDSWHIAWGIRFPGSDSEWWKNCEPPLPPVLFAFVTVISEERGPTIPVVSLKSSDLPRGWSVDAKAGELIIANPLHAFRQDAEGMANDMAVWISTEAMKIIPVVNVLAGMLR